MKNNSKQLLIELPLASLHAVGLNYEKQNFSSKLRLLLFSCISIFADSLIFTFIYLNISDFGKIGDALGNSPLLYQSVCKMLTTVLNAKKYVVVLKDIKQFWSFGKDDDGYCSEEVVDRIKFYKKIAKGFFYLLKIYAWMTCILYILRPIFQMKKEIPAVWYEICDLKGNLCFAASFTTQSSNIIGIAFTNVGYDGLFLIFVTYVCCDLEFIKNGFVNLKISTDNEEELFQSYKRLIHHHSFILKFIKNMNEIYAILIFNQYYTTMLTICMDLLLLTQKGSPPYRCFTFITVASLELAIYCTGGQFILNQSLGVAEAAYECKWTEKYRKNIGDGLCMIIRSAQTSEVLSIGKLRNLDLQSFKDALTNSVSFFTVFQAVYAPEAK